MANYNLEKRKYVIGAVATGIVIIYILRLFCAASHERRL